MMNSTDKLVKKILATPQASLIVEKVSDVLEREQEKRQAFYEWVDEDMKAEFINGEIIVHSPVMKEHNDATKNLLSLLDTYVKKKDLGYVSVEKVMVRFTRNDYEPDLCYFTKEKSKNFEQEQHLFPIPDMVVEVRSKSTAKNDKETKFKDYEQHGVREYWMVFPRSKQVEQYILIDGLYQLNLKSKEGFIRSHVTEGFEIPIQAIFDDAIQLETLKSILVA